MTEADARGSILSAEELARQRKLHIPFTYEDGSKACNYCGKAWPCLVAALLVHVEAQQQEMERLANALDREEDNSAELSRQFQQADAALSAMKVERDEARQIVANINNEVIGSHGYFTTPSCVKAVQELKLLANQRWATLAAQAARIDQLETDLRQIQNYSGTVQALNKFIIAALAGSRPSGAQDPTRPCQHELKRQADRCRHGYAWGTTCEHCILSCPQCWDSYSSSSTFGPRPSLPVPPTTEQP